MCRRWCRGVNGVVVEMLVVEMFESKQNGGKNVDEGSRYGCKR